jgi:hypothetical protein
MPLLPLRPLPPLLPLLPLLLPPRPLPPPPRLLLLLILVPVPCCATPCHLIASLCCALKIYMPLLLGVDTITSDTPVTLFT